MSQHSGGGATSASAEGRSDTDSRAGEADAQDVASGEASTSRLAEGPEADASPTEMAQRNAAPGTSAPPIPGDEQLTNRGVDRGVIIGEGLRAASTWSLRLLIISVAVAAVLWLLGRLWVGVFPILLALIVSTVLWPVTAWLRRKLNVPAALASLGVLVVALGVFFGVLAAIAPSIVRQSQELLNTATQGLVDVQNWLAGPPLNISSDQIGNLVSQLTSYLQRQSGQIASGLLGGVSVITNFLVTLALVLVLTFFFLKDGPEFVPMLRRMAGRTAGRHLTEVSVRCWNTLGGFIRAQAIVSFVDAFFIGLGLVILGIPLAIPLAVLTFFGGFIPIVGAFAVGALAVLVALVSNGFTTAVIVLLIILAVQQLEGNILQPFLQGRQMQLHAGVILLAVAAGGTLFGIAGAFLAVPVAATGAVVLRYMSEQIDLRAGDLRAEDVPVATKDGAVSAARAEQAADHYLAEAPTALEPADAAARAGQVNPGGRLGRLARWRERREEQS